MSTFNFLMAALEYGLYNANAFRTRSIGLVSELEFLDHYLNIPKNRNKKVLNGGYFVSLNEGKGALENFIYYTIIDNKEDLGPYLHLYQHLFKLKGNAYYLIQTALSEDIASWDLLNLNGIKWPVPKISLYMYKGEKNEFDYISDSLDPMIAKFKLNPKYKCFKQSFSADNINSFKTNFDGLLPEIQKKMYFERFVLDVYIGSRHIRGVPTDIDIIIFDKNKITDPFTFLEIKEKDLAKKIKGFGLDSHRLNDLMTISSSTNIPYYLVVKQVRDQQSREFLNWKYINIADFKKHMNNQVITGGTGMRSIHSVNPTYICPVEHFKLLK